MTTAAADDTGAETLQRYRYQAAYAAWLAITALDNVPDAVAVYCEHHDDVLLEMEDGRCDAIQIKSQLDGSGPLKGTSEPVLKSLKHFSVLEHQYGPRFRRYRLAAISGFHRVGKSSSNLGHCLDQAASCDGETALETPLSILVQRIKAPKEIPQETVVGALQKVQLDESLPKLNDMETRVREAVERLEGVGQHRASDLVDAAMAVIDLAFDAGAATKATSSASYVAYLEDPEAHASSAAIESKRLALEDVRSVIRDAAEQSALLRSEEGSDITKLPATSGIARRKLDAGGIPVHTAGILDDLRSSAESAISDRLYKDGPEAATADYDHLKVLVETLAEDSRLEAAGGNGKDYGPAMYLALRKRLIEQSEGGSTSTRGFSPEQLTGIAVILTELCKVWWSEPFELETVDG